MHVVQCAPGKLYIAGEYAVVEPGYPAVIAAVDRFVSVHIEKKETYGRIQFASTELSLKRDAMDQWCADGDVFPFRFVLSAIEHAERYIQALGKHLGVYQLTVSSDLTEKDGRKYGLGSSAAVTVACVKAVLAFYEVSLDQQIVFKLAALAHLDVQGNGSCGDVAAAVYGGWVAYTSFDRHWLAQADRTGKDLLGLLYMNWPKLSIRQLECPPDLHLIVGWTGTPSSTAKLINRVEEARSGREKGYRLFLDQSKTCVEKIIAGFVNQQSEIILEGIRQNRRILAQFSKLCGVLIETDKLHQLCTIAENNHGAAKASGAGGGDCGIVLATQETNQKALLDEWNVHGITPLDLHVSNEGVLGKEDHEMESRKDQHVRLFQETQKEHSNDFDCVKFIHDSLPEMSLEQIDDTTELPFGIWPIPFYINGMTGGSEKTKKINECLSQAAAATGIAVASGSQKAALKDPDLRDTFQVLRQVNPNGFIFANIGAELDCEQAKRAIDMLEANGLQVHLNAPQEIVMPEGDRDFSSWLKNLEKIVRAVNVPVIVKEVGFGMSRATYKKLLNAGAEVIDVAGNGGVNFISIENHRRERAQFDYLQDWGQSTVISLLEAQPYIDQTTFFASGGVRQPLDVLKALAFGARAVGISGMFLHTALTEGKDGLITQINEWKEQIKQIMLLLGCSNLQALRTKSLILSGAPLEWAGLRGLKPEKLAMRSSCRSSSGK